MVRILHTALCLAALLPWTALAEEPAAPPEDAQAAIAERDAAQQTFVRLTDEERYEEAITIGQQIVDLTTRIHGDRSIELAVPLGNLATAQLRHGDYPEAEANYRASIAIIERNDGLGSARVINPLVGLAETYMRVGAYESANATYRQALQVNHAATGFYNLEQVKILDGLSESYLGLGKTGPANAQQRIQVGIQRHRSGPESPEVVDALDKLGKWYNRTGQYPEARDAYQSARRILRQTKGASDAANVDALLGEALSYENEGAVAESANTLKRALDLLDAAPERDHVKRAEVLVALGDLYIVSRQPRSARVRYGQAWTELSGDESLVTERDAYFAKPSLISGPRLPTLVGSDGKTMTSEGTSELAKGYVLASMTIDPDGQARNPVVIESEPAGFMDKDVLRSLGNTSFRPRMEDGESVTSDGIQFRHDFRYPQAVVARPSPEPVSAPEAAGEKGERINYPDQPDEPGSKPPP